MNIARHSYETGRTYKLLHTSNVDVVDGAEVENDRLQSGLIRDVVFFVARLWSWIAPRSITWSTVGERVGSSGDLKDMLGELVEVMVGIWIVKSFREAVDENTRIWCFDLNVWVRAIVVIDRQEYIARPQFWTRLVA